MKSQPQILKRIAEKKETLASENAYMKRLDEQGLPHDSDHWVSHRTQIWSLRDTIAALEWVLGIKS